METGKNMDITMSAQNADRDASEYAAKEAANEVPIGFGFSLAMNEKAMRVFGGMTKAEQDRWISLAGKAESKADMEKLVNRIGGTENRMF